MTGCKTPREESGMWKFTILKQIINVAMKKTRANVNQMVAIKINTEREQRLKEKSNIDCNLCAANLRNLLTGAKKIAHGSSYITVSLIILTTLIHMRSETWRLI